MTTTLDQILVRARAAGQELAPAESGALFAAAIRLAAAQGATLRSQLVQLDDAGQLSLLPFDDRAPHQEPGYLAPELLEGDTENLKLSEPRVQVYAAGALGYELFTGQPPPDPRTGPGPELSGPLGDIARIALAGDRRERFGDLTQLADAVLGVQPRLGADRERQIFAAVLARSFQCGPEEKHSEVAAQVGEVSARLEELRARLDRLQSREAGLLERLERFEDGQQLGAAGLRKAPSPWVPTLVAAILASLLTLGAAWQLGVLQATQPAPLARDQAQPEAQRPVAQSQPPPAPEPKRPLAQAQPQLPAAPLPEERDAGPAALAAVPSALPAPEPVALVPAVDAGSPAALAQAPSQSPSPARDAAEAAPAPPEPGRDRASTQVNAKPRSSSSPGRRRDATEPASPASAPRMAHAVAQSQVNRGEKALELGRLEEALKSFRQALDNEASLAVAYRGLGMAYAMQSNDSLALQSYQKYLSLAPGAADSGEIKKAIEELKSRAKIGGADDK